MIPNKFNLTRFDEEDSHEIFVELGQDGLKVITLNQHQVIFTIPWVTSPLLDLLLVSTTEIVMPLQVENMSYSFIRAIQYQH